MDSMNGTFLDVLNSSHGANINTISAALGISHLLFVVFPSLIISSAVIYYLYLLMKTSGFRPVLLLYCIISVLCIAGPSMYALVELATVLALQNDDGVTCALATVYYVLVFGTATIASYSTALVAVAQCLVLHSHQRQVMTVAKVVFSFVVIVLFAAAFNVALNIMDCIKYAGDYVTATVWAFVAFVVPLVVTVVFSILTCFKVKNSVVENTKTVVKSVVTINTINLLFYITFRFVGVVVFFIGVTSSDSESTLVIWKDVSFVIADIGYPLTALSILVLHTKVRQMAFKCNRSLSEHDNRELTNSSKVAEVSNL